MDSAHRKKLVRQRAVAKSSLTCLQNFIEVSECKLHDLQVRYEELPNILCKFETAQNELEITDDSDYSLGRESFEQQYFQVKAKFIELLHPADTQGRSADNQGQSDNVSEPGNNQLPGLNHARHSYVKLPTIQLPSYDGTITTWLHFRDTFDSLIIQNKMLSNVQKFQYLLSSLKGEAKQLIANLQISHDNFVVAWDLVTQRYNNIKLIAMTHVKQLLQLPQVKKNDPTSLCHLINHVISNMNAIQALALNTSMQDLMLNHLLLSVQDSETHKEWQLQTATQQDNSTTSTVINFLEARCKALELLQANQSTSTTTSQQSPTSRFKVSQSSRCNLVTQDQCPLCKETHRLVYCAKFKRMSPRQRKDYAQQIRACYNCLQPYSKSHNCSKGACHVCNKQYHTLLHGNAQNSSASDRRPITNHNPSANQRSSTPAEVNTYCSLKSKPINHVLLATAIVEVKNKYNKYVPCRVLLDSASQLNFISEKCVQRLRLPRTQTPVNTRY